MSFCALLAVPNPGDDTSHVGTYDKLPQYGEPEAASLLPLANNAENIDRWQVRVCPRPPPPKKEFLLVGKYGAPPKLWFHTPNGISIGSAAVLAQLAAVICQQSYLLFGIPSSTHSFIPVLKPPFSANPSHCSPSFSSSGLTTWIPQTVYCYF